MTTKVAVIQHNAGTDVEKNLSTLEILSKQAAGEGAEIICWAEAFAYLGRHEGKLEILEPLPEGGPILTRCKNLAKNLGVEILLGGFHESDPTDSTKCFNTSVYLSSTGEINGVYRKIHLFDVDIADGPRLMESKHTTPGDQAVVVNSLIGDLGMTVCYDLRFPNLFQKLADMGSLAISVPSAFTKTTGEMHWHHLLCARAIENQTYIFAPAQHGQHSKNRASYGHSVIVDPWGRIVCELPEGDGYAIGEFDQERIDSVRSQLPSLSNRRTFN